MIKKIWRVYDINNEELYRYPVEYFKLIYQMKDKTIYENTISVRQLVFILSDDFDYFRKVIEENLEAENEYYISDNSKHVGDFDSKLDKNLEDCFLTLEGFIKLSKTLLHTSHNVTGSFFATIRCRLRDLNRRSCYECLKVDCKPIFMDNKLVISGLFLDKLFIQEGLSKRLVKYKTFIEGEDYFLRDDLFEENKDFYSSFIANYQSLKYDVFFTETGVEKYFEKVKWNRFDNELMDRAKIVENFFNNTVSEDNVEEKIDCENSIESFDLIREDKFGVKFTTELISNVIKFNEDNLCEVINGKYEIEADIKRSFINGTSVPFLETYIDKDAFRYTLMYLYNEALINKEQLLFLMTKVIAKQVNMESCI